MKLLTVIELLAKGIDFVGLVCVSLLQFKDLTALGVNSVFQGLQLKESILHQLWEGHLISDVVSSDVVEPCSHLFICNPSDGIFIAEIGSLCESLLNGFKDEVPLLPHLHSLLFGGRTSRTHMGEPLCWRRRNLGWR